MTLKPLEQIRCTNCFNPSVQIRCKLIVPDDCMQVCMAVTQNSKRVIIPKNSEQRVIIHFSDLDAIPADKYGSRILIEFLKQVSNDLFYNRPLNASASKNVKPCYQSIKRVLSLSLPSGNRTQRVLRRSVWMGWSWRTHVRFHRQVHRLTASEIRWSASYSIHEVRSLATKCSLNLFHSLKVGWGRETVGNVLLRLEFP